MRVYKTRAANINMIITIETWLVTRRQKSWPFSAIKSITVRTNY